MCRALMDMSAAPVSIRMDAAHTWAVSAVKIAGDPAVALEPLSGMVHLLPELLWRGVGRQTQELLLGNHPGLASMAAAAAVAAGQPATAVRLLEIGRTTLWAQQAQDRSELTAPTTAAPDLASPLSAIRQAFAESPDPARYSLDQPGQHEASRQIALAIEWDETVAQVRRVPGFESFPELPLPDPQTAATAGPIVLVNLHLGGWGDHALVITVEGITAIPLHVGEAGGAAKISEYLVALDDTERDQGITARLQRERIMVRTLEWLWDAIAERCGLSRVRPPARRRSGLAAALVVPDRRAVPPAVACRGLPRRG